MGGLAIIAGAGRLPQLLADSAQDRNQLVTVVCFAGNEDLNWAPDVPVTSAQFERPQSLFDALHAQDVTQVVFAGAMNRPAMDPTKFDGTLTRYAPQLLPAIQKGDNAVLTVVLDMFSHAGFEILRPEDTRPDLLARASVLTTSQPTKDDISDAATAAAIVQHLGKLDIGQGAVVAQGLCLATETLPGTDAMLHFVAGLDRDRLPLRNGARGVLFKGPKPDQDRRVDLPAIGSDTVDLAVKAGLAGIVVEAEGILIIDRDATIAAADAAGLFIWARAADQQ